MTRKLIHLAITLVAVWLVCYALSEASGVANIPDGPRPVMSE